MSKFLHEEQSLLENIADQPAMKFPALYGTQKLIQK
jgi:hypothetical protein